MYSGNRWQLAADYNAWMNERLYAVCALPSDEDRKRNRRAFLKSIHSTLNHILWAHRNWMTRLAGKSYTPAVSLGADIFADFDELQAARATLDAQIGEWAAGLTEDRRGQLTTLLSQAGVSYGDTDVLLMPQLE
jgi:uncharacterized damage-inducible protein DinB